MLDAVEDEHHRQKAMELEGAQLLIAGAPRMIRKLLKWCLIGLVLVMAVGAASGHREGGAAAASCHGKVTRVYLPRARYPHIDDHAEDAIAGRTADGKHWPRVLRVNRAGAAQRRAFAVAQLPSRSDMDRDEYPPAVGRSTMRADVRYVDNSENQGAGASMGNRLRGLPDGACFRYVFTSRGEV